VVTAIVARIAQQIADIGGHVPSDELEPAPQRADGAQGRGAGDARTRTTRLRPTRGIPSLRLKEFWEFRELLYFVSWREVKVRYRQTAFGAVWAILQPVLLMLVFTLFLGKIAKVGGTDVPYPLFAFAGLIPWTFFSQSLAASSESLVGNRNLVAKIYFPRLLLPVGVAAAFLIDVGFSLVVYVILMVGYGMTPEWQIVLLPGFIAVAFLTSISVALWLSALNVRYRDVRYAVPFIIQLWLFATPVAYPPSLVGSGWGQTVLGLNPMAGVVEGFRWVLRGSTPPSGMLAVSLGMIVLVLVGGVFYFRTMERTFADVI
jgi:homopolymeric O-antigen transport system permease protein